MAPSEAEGANSLARTVVEILPLFGEALRQAKSNDGQKSAQVGGDVDKFRELQGQAENLCQEKRGEDSLVRSMEALRIGAQQSRGQDLSKARAKAVKVVPCVAECLRQTGNGAGVGQAMCALAALQVARNRPAAAVESANDAANAFRKLGNMRDEATASALIVDAHMAKASSLAAGKNFRQSHQLKMTPSEAQDDLNRARGKIFQDAVRAADDTLTLLTQTKQTRAKADLLCRMAEMHVLCANLEDAKEAAMTARDLYHELQDTRGEQAALLVEMDAHLADRDGAEAVDVAREITKVFRKAKDKRGEVEGMLLQMKVFSMMGQVEDMARLSKDVRTLCQSLNDKKLEGHLVSAMMNAHIDKGDINLALTESTEAAELYRKAGDKSGEARALHARGCLELDAFFKKLESDMVQFRKMGCMEQYYKEADLTSYEASLGHIKKAAALFEEAEDVEGQTMARETLLTSDKKAAMMNDPNETKQVWKDGNLVDIIQVWNPDQAEANPAIADVAQ